MLNDNAFASTSGSPLVDVLNRARNQQVPLAELFQVTENFNLTGDRANAA